MRGRSPLGSANREDGPVTHHAIRRSGVGALAASAAFSSISSRFSVSELSTHWRMTARIDACLLASADVIFPLAARRYRLAHSRAMSPRVCSLPTLIHPPRQGGSFSSCASVSGVSSLMSFTRLAFSHIHAVVNWSDRACLHRWRDDKDLGHIAVTSQHRSRAARHSVVPSSCW